MNTLLPKRHSRGLLVEYLLRNLVVILIFVLIALGIYLVSVYMALGVARALHTEAQSLLTETNQGGLTTLSQDPKREGRVAYVLAHEGEGGSGLILERLAALGSSAISIISITLERKEGVYEVVVGGTARARSDLVQFQDAIRKDGYIADPYIPLESFAKDRDLTFSLRGKISP